jgi:transcriptional/translational regulatory protein YebC/TACO1
MERVIPFDAEEVEMAMMDLAITDITVEDGIAEVYTTKSDFLVVRKQIEEL